MLSGNRILLFYLVNTVVFVYFILWLEVNPYYLKTTQTRLIVLQVMFISFPQVSTCIAETDILTVSLGQVNPEKFTEIDRKIYGAFLNPLIPNSFNFFLQMPFANNFLLIIINKCRIKCS